MGRFLNWLEVALHFAGGLLAKLPPVVQALIVEGVHLAQRAVDGGAQPLTGAAKNQLVTEYVTAGIEAYNVVAEELGRPRVDLDPAAVSAAISELVDAAKQIAASVAAASSMAHTSASKGTSPVALLATAAQVDQLRSQQVASRAPARMIG